MTTETARPVLPQQPAGPPATGDPLTDPTAALLEPAQIGPLSGIPQVTGYRAVPRQRTMSDELGPLQDLPGVWEGPGFSLIARPDFDADNEDGFFLQLNLLRETLEFTTIGSPVFNRGSLQSDIALFGVTYLHRVTDAITGGALHIEPGLFLTIPATTQPESGPSIARLATVPHGNAACAVGSAESLVGPPSIPPVNTVPFPIGAPPPPLGTINPFAAFNLAKESPFRTSPLPPNITQAVIDDPTTLTRAALRGLEVEEITRLTMNTPPAGGVANIPFIAANADNPTLDSTFWIESIKARADASTSSCSTSRPRCSASAG